MKDFLNTWYSLSRNKEGEKQWGKYNIPIYTDKDCINVIESSTQREGFYIHGGESYGDNGGIDLAKEDTRFFKVLESIKEEYKEVLESIQDDKGRMVVRLEVGYEGEVSERLSEHFWVKDMIQTSYGQMYIDLNKKFAMQPKHNKQLKKLCAELEKIRQFALNNGYMLQITSGVRCPELNKKLEPNASKTSQHLNASAADMIFVKNGISSKEGLKLIYKALYSNNPAERIQGIDRDKTFSQVIIERSKNSVWLHCAIFDDKYIANRRVTYGNHWVEKTEYRYSPNGQANNCPFLNDISDLDKI